MATSKTILARRFGYGPAGQQSSTPESLVSDLRGRDDMKVRFPAISREEIDNLRKAYSRAAQSFRSGKTNDPTALAAARLDLREVKERSLTLALARIVATATPFRERLVWFWADHFTVVAKLNRTEGWPVDFVETAIRPHVAGNFADMLKASTIHPAMVSYLDQMDSVGPSSPAAKDGKRGLNENLAREILELHTLGVGGDYTQADVREFAELLTGLVRVGETPFKRSQAEPGAETVLGREYGGKRPKLDDILTALDDLAHHPSTARHLARKLAVHFVSDAPPDDMVDQMAAAYMKSGGDLLPVYKAMLAHPGATAPAPEKARQPFDFIAAALRSMQIAPKRLVDLDQRMLRLAMVRPLTLMGQPFMAPNGPDGWAEASSAWLTSQGLAARIAWAMRVPERLLHNLPDPVDFARVALADDASEALIVAASRAQTRGEAIGVILSSPEFNLR
jgi:uncharacterized protein (DUF1800 family)